MTRRHEAEEMRDQLAGQLSAAAVRTAELERSARMLTEALAVEQVALVAAGVGGVTIGALRSLVALIRQNSVQLLVVDERLSDVPDKGGSRLELGLRSVVTNTIKTRQPISMEDLDDMTRPFQIDIDPSHIAATPYGPSWTTVPLVIAGTPIGALKFFFDQPRKITEQEGVFLRALAGQCTLALQRLELLSREPTATRTAQRSLFSRKRGRPEHQVIPTRQTCVDLIHAVAELRDNVANSHEYSGDEMAARLGEIRKSATASQVHAFTISLLAPALLAEQAERLANAAARLAEVAVSDTDLDRGWMIRAPDFKELDACTESFRQVATADARR